MENVMNILLLCEGDAETRDSWSGISKSLVDTLRVEGHTVRTGDVDLYGPGRWWAACRSFSASRRRWWVKFHLGAAAFHYRTRAAERAVKRNRGWTDLILQIGATFKPAGRGDTPYVVYCDSNILLADSARRTGYTDAFSLDACEVSEIRDREAAIYRDATTILTMSHMLRQSFIRDFAIPADHVHCIHAGPNFDVTRIPHPRPPRPPGPPTILFVGRQFERKGGDLLLRAFRELRYLLPDVRLLVIGPAKLNINEPGVEVLGFLPKDDPAASARLQEAYARADVFCLPTRFEPFGIAFLEAMYFGLPCIGPDAWAVPEMIIHGETGFTVAPDDQSALATRLRQLLENPALAQNLGAKGRERASRHFTWEATVDRMLAAIEMNENVKVHERT
jgi:alpha-maltose-1-phosphate synthase